MSYAHNMNQQLIAYALVKSKVKWSYVSAALNGTTKSASTSTLRRLKKGSFVTIAKFSMNSKRKPLKK